jgi:hypothetical protein
MTPREYQTVYEGYLINVERQASFFTSLMGVHLGKKTPKLHEITGFRFKRDVDAELEDEANTIAEGVKRTSKEEREEVLAHMKKVFGE